MAVFGLALLVAAALAPEPIPVAPPDAPKGKWVASWEDRACALARLTDEAKPASLVLSLVPGTTYFRTTLVSPAIGRGAAAQAKYASLMFGDRVAGKEGQAKAVHTDRGDGFDFTLLDETLLRDLAEASSLSVRTKDGILVQVPLPNARAAVAELGRCSEDALRAWGIDPVARAALRRQPKPVIELWRLVTPDDYPTSALAAGISGQTTVRLRIGAAGGVVGCAVAVSSGNKDLDTQTCAVFMRRAHFEPALGPDGQPAEAFFVSSLRWWTQ